MFSLWRKARRENSAASRLLGSTSLRFALHGWQRLSPRDADAQYLYEDLYCARGEMENRIKEQQLGLFADRTSSATLQANQLRLYFSSFAYVLLHGLRRLGLTGTAFAKAQSTTIRLKLLKIGARLRLTARKVWLSFSEAYPYASDIAQILANLKQHPAWSPPG
ncbi:transposase [Thiolapillus sp.]|uniref:transposase n=1 Tax=Thiolapillus sp. TaxID=2017437 RepID=UPI003AF63DAC